MPAIRIPRSNFKVRFSGDASAVRFTCTVTNGKAAVTLR